MSIQATAALAVRSRSSRLLRPQGNFRLRSSGWRYPEGFSEQPPRWWKEKQKEKRKEKLTSPRFTYRDVAVQRPPEAAADRGLRWSQEGASTHGGTGPSCLTVGVYNSKTFNQVRSNQRWSATTW